MPLDSLFPQRVVGTTFGSIRTRVSLRTPSGPQQAESALEKELLLQIDCSPNVVDVITQPMIEYEIDGKARTYSLDAFLQVGPGLPHQPQYYLIEVKREAELRKKGAAFAAKFAGARRWCKEHAAEFRIVTDRDIRSPYLGNAQLLRHLLGQEPDNDCWCQMRSLVAKSDLSVGALRSALMRSGWSYLKANTAIQQCVANTLLGCDLTQPFVDGTMLSLPTWEGVHDHQQIPILKMIMSCRSELEQFGNDVLQ